MTETFATNFTQLYEQGVISFRTLLSEFEIDTDEEMKSMREEESLQKQFEKEYCAEGVNTSNRFFDEELIRNAQKQISEVANDPDMTIVTSSHIPTADFLDDFTEAVGRALGLPQEFVFSPDSKFSKLKKGDNNNNIEYIGGVCEQIPEDNVRDVFDYNDVISYFEEKGDKNNGQRY